MSEEKNNNQVQQEINRLVENGLKALDEFRLLNQAIDERLKQKADQLKLDDSDLVVISDKLERFI